MDRPITNDMDLIDSREVVEAIAEMDGQELTEEELVYLLSLLELARQGEGVEDWQYGATLVRDSYFVDYARDLAIDCAGTREESEILAGRGVGEFSRWPFTHMSIDWEAAAADLQVDYTDVTFDGVTYWVR